MKNKVFYYIIIYICKLYNSKRGERFLKILVINAGSSSLKYQLIDMDDEHVIAKGICERIGTEKSIICAKTGDGRRIDKEVLMDNHTQAFNEVKAALTCGACKVIDDLKEIDAVGHRVVQGGSLYKESVIIDDKVIQGIADLSDLAPLHNPAHIQGIKACREVLGDSVPMVAVFDNAFHSTMPPKAYMYAIPYEYYQKYGIRRYGFHGTSHKYISRRCAEVMGRSIKELKLVTCHLGNGSSITAVEYGKVIDTSMGMTPLDGFMMGTRSGTLDPSVVTFIGNKEQLTPAQVDALLNKKSGVFGISGTSSDDRDICRAEDEGNERAILAHEMQAYQIIKYIGSYVAAMNGVDAIVFTGGIGENGIRLRKNIISSLGYLGVSINKCENKRCIGGTEGMISTPESKVKVYVLATNEELEIAEETKELIESK